MRQLWLLSAVLVLKSPPPNWTHNDLSVGFWPSVLHLFRQYYSAKKMDWTWIETAESGDSVAAVKCFLVTNDHTKVVG